MTSTMYVVCPIQSKLHAAHSVLEILMGPPIDEESKVIATTTTNPFRML